MYVECSRDNLNLDRYVALTITSTTGEENSGLPLLFKTKTTTKRGEAGEEFKIAFVLVPSVA